MVKILFVLPLFFLTGCSERMRNTSLGAGLGTVAGGTLAYIGSGGDGKATAMGAIAGGVAGGALAYSVTSLREIQKEQQQEIDMLRQEMQQLRRDQEATRRVTVDRSGRFVKIEKPRGKKYITVKLCDSSGRVLEQSENVYNIY